MPLRLERVVETDLRRASDSGRGACRTCRRPCRACRATPGAGAHQREVAARGGHPAHPVGRRGPNAVEQDPLVPVDPVHVDIQHAGRLDRFQPRQKSFHAPNRRARRAGLDVMQRRVRMLVADGDQRVEAVAHRRRQMLRHALRQQGAGLVPGRPHRPAQHRVGRRENGVRREASLAPTLAATPCGRAAALRLRGTAPAVRQRRCRTCADAGTHRCAADTRKPSAAGGRLEEGGIADQARAEDGVGDRHGSVRHKRPFWPDSSAAGNMTRSVSRICQIQYAKLHSIDRP